MTEARDPLVISGDRVTFTEHPDILITANAPASPCPGSKGAMTMPRLKSKKHWSPPKLSKLSASEKAEVRLKIEEMAAFDALGCLTRRVISEAPAMLDARKISKLSGIPIDQLGLYDEELASSIACMIDDEYGQQSPRALR